MEVASERCRERCGSGAALEGKRGAASEPERSAGADLMAAFVAVLTPDQRRRLAALLLAENDGPAA